MSATTPTGPADGSGAWQPGPGLVQLAFGSLPASSTLLAREGTHLSLLPPDMLALDLSQPEQRELGDYELLEVIGEGGMGVVYRARQRSLDREVALKLLGAGPWASEEFIAGFHSEARNAALLQHPNIVAVHAMAEQDGLVFYAMELVRGQSLAQRLREGPLPPAEAARLMRTVAEAVDYAHRLGVLHLDLKPGNILLEADGTAKVTDFGLARRLGQALSLDNERISGTPSYMAPEQARVYSSKLSPATDVWGLGAVLYELLAGVPPFLGRNPQDTLRQVMEGPVRGFGRRARIPRDLEAICLHCLEKQPGQRYPSARALADDLGRLLEGREVAVRPLNAGQRVARWARREPRFAAAAAIAVLAVLAGLAATTQQWRRADRNARVVAQQLWSQRGAQAWRAIADQQPLDALSPLVQNLLEQERADDTDAATVSRMRIAGVLSQAPALVQVIDVGAPVFVVTLARDGRWVAAATEDGFVHLYDLPSGRQRWRTDTRRATHFMMQAAHVGYLWEATDGRYLLAARPYPDPVANPSGANQLRLDLATGALWRPPQAGYRDATFSPDGEFALVRTQQLRVQRVHVGDGGTDSPWRAFDPSNPAWLLSAGGRYVAVTTEGYRRVELWDGATLRTRHGVVFPEAQHLRSWVFTPDATQLVLGHQDGRITLVDTATGQQAPLQPQRPASVERLEISGDGRWLAVAYDDGYALAWDLPSRTLLSQPMHPGDGLFLLSVDPDTRTAFSRNEQAATVWRIPDTPGDAAVLQRRPSLPATRYARSNAWAPAVGLLATGTLAGQIRLWRTHQAVPLPWPPAPQPTPTAFDGRHVVAVTGARVQVMDALGRNAAAPAIDYPQGVGFAFFAGGGGALVASAGHRVHVSDWRTGKARFPPIALDNAPGRLLASVDGEVLVAGEQVRRDGGGRTHLTAWSLRDGRRLGSAWLDSPLHGWRLSGDGRYLLAWRNGELHVLHAESLAPVRPMHRFGPDVIAVRRALFARAGPVEITDPAAYWGVGILDADVDPGQPLVWVLTGDFHLYALPLKGGPPSRDILVPAQPTRIEANQRGVAIFSADKGLLAYSSAQGLHATVDAGAVDMPLLARSGDGRRLAVGTRHGALLQDAASGEWLTPPLDVVDDVTDPIHSLTLDRHGESLLVQTLRRRFVLPIPRESRPAAELARLVPLWRPQEALDAPIDATADASARAQRIDPRQPDPGAASLAPTPAPLLPPAPLRPAQSRFVDLRPACNVMGDQAGESWPPTLLLRTLPRGPQRMYGRDFWIDCGVGATMAEFDAELSDWPTRSAAIPLQRRRFASLDVLLTGLGTTAGFADTPYALIVLQYADGGQAELVIHARTQVWPWWHDGTDVPEQPLAYLSQFAEASEASSWQSLSRFYAVRLANPHPEREVRALTIAATPHAWSSPLVLAITLLPPERAQPGNPAIAHQE